MEILIVFIEFFGWNAKYHTPGRNWYFTHAQWGQSRRCCLPCAKVLFVYNLKLTLEATDLWFLLWVDCLPKERNFHHHVVPRLIEYGNHFLTTSACAVDPSSWSCPVFCVCHTPTRSPLNCMILKWSGWMSLWWDQFNLFSDICQLWRRRAKIGSSVSLTHIMQAL